MKYVVDPNKVFKLIHSTGKTLDCISAKCGISKSTLGGMRSEDNKVINIDTLVKVCDYFKIKDVREILKQIDETK